MMNDYCAKVSSNYGKAAAKKAVSQFNITDIVATWIIDNCNPYCHYEEITYLLERLYEKKPTKPPS